MCLSVSLYLYASASRPPSLLPSSLCPPLSPPLSPLSIPFPPLLSLLLSPPSTVIKFADDTTVLGRIAKNDETAYRREVDNLAKWCQENNLSLNVDKTKELVIDYRRKGEKLDPITIDGAAVERVSSFKFLGVHITDKLTWDIHTNHVVKKAQQRLYHLRRLKKFGMTPKILKAFYRGTTESILTGCITAWRGSCTGLNLRALSRVVRTAKKICGCELPSIQDIYESRCVKKARKIIKDFNHPNHGLFQLMRSGKRYRSHTARTNRLKNSFFPQAIRLINRAH